MAKASALLGLPAEEVAKREQIALTSSPLFSPFMTPFMSGSPLMQEACAVATNDGWQLDSSRQTLKV